MQDSVVTVQKDSIIASFGTTLSPLGAIVSRFVCAHVCLSATVPCFGIMHIIIENPYAVLVLSSSAVFAKDMPGQQVMLKSNAPRTLSTAYRPSFVE